MLCQAAFPTVLENAPKKGRGGGLFIAALGLRSAIFLKKPQQRIIYCYLQKLAEEYFLEDL